MHKKALLTNLHTQWGKQNILFLKNNLLQLGHS